MFGKPEWFQKKKWGWGLTPVSWQGWVYAILWGLLIAIPFNVLLHLRGPWEGGIWLAAGTGLLIFDVAQIMRAMSAVHVVRDPSPTSSPVSPTPKAASDVEVLYIGDDGRVEHLSTPRFDLRLQSRT